MIVAVASLLGKRVLKLELDANFIKRAAKQELQNIGRKSFSKEGFSDKEISAIAQAISAAIAEYDRQRNQKT